MRVLFLACAVLASTVGIVPAWAESDFVLYSQNLLRFGQGSNTTQKCQAIIDEAAVADIIVIQELMTAYYPCLTPAGSSTYPTGFSFLSFGPFGTSSYKEYYGFLWRNTSSGTHPKVEFQHNCIAPDCQGSKSVFARPPTAMLFKVTTTTKVFYIWIGNMHSVFGKTVAGRQIEASAAGDFFSVLRNWTYPAITPPAGGWPTIIAGDWNLPITDSTNTVTNPGFSWLTNQAAAGKPTNVATSLTRAGAASSPYDHILYNTATVTLSAQVTLNPPQPGQWPDWRQNVSDHLGVQVQVSVP